MTRTIAAAIETKQNTTKHNTKNDTSMTSPVQVITFDLWDTLIVDDSDEPKRAALGMEDKKTARRTLVYEMLSKTRPMGGPTENRIDRPMVDLAYDVTDSAFSKVWHEQFVTWTVKERIDVLLNGLGVKPAEDDLESLVKAHEEMELKVSPDFVENLRPMLETLKQKYRLAVVSDAIFSPGTTLRMLLKKASILDCFHAFAFSDEVGRSKPHRAMFDAIASELDVSIESIVHIGDREHNDIKGPKNLGARAILTTTVIDRGSENTDADAVCKNYNELPKILAQLEGKP